MQSLSYPWKGCSCSTRIRLSAPPSLFRQVPPRLAALLPISPIHTTDCGWDGLFLSFSVATKSPRRSRRLPPVPPRGYGLPVPKGVLIVGLPGKCKSLTAIAGVLTEFVPLSKLMAEQITALRQWSKGRARPATSPTAPGRRLRKLGV